jgi:hypothetical protein
MWGRGTRKKVGGFGIHLRLLGDENSYLEIGRKEWTKKYVFCV